MLITMYGPFPPTRFPSTSEDKLQKVFHWLAEEGIKPTPTALPTM